MYRRHFSFPTLYFTNQWLTKYGWCCWKCHVWLRETLDCKLALGRLHQHVCMFLINLYPANQPVISITFFFNCLCWNVGITAWREYTRANIEVMPVSVRHELIFRYGYRYRQVSVSGFGIANKSQILQILFYICLCYLLIYVVLMASETKFNTKWNSKLLTISIYIMHMGSSKNVEY